MKYLATALTLLFALPLAGKPCPEDLPVEGICVTPTLVAWCEDGEEKTWTCQAGQSCKWNPGIGAFDCVAGGCDYDLDGDGVPEPVPTTGACASPGKVVWCEAGELRKLKCGPGSTCAWNDDAGEAGANDCVDTTGPPADEDLPSADASSSADASPSADAGAPEPSPDTGWADANSADAGTTDATRPSPDAGLRPVQYDDTGTRLDSTGLSGGCTATPGAAPTLPLALVLLALVLMRARP